MATVNRTARALAKAQSGTDDWDCLDDGLQQKLREEACVVLQAIFDPDDAASDALPASILRKYAIDQQSRDELIRMCKSF